VREKCAPSPESAARSASLHHLLSVTLNQVIEAHTSKPHTAGAEVSNASHHLSIPGLATMPSEAVSSKRDPRIDVLRGMALLNPDIQGAAFARDR
jgi:hypothetical protein